MNSDSVSDVFPLFALSCIVFWKREGEFREGSASPSVMVLYHSELVFVVKAVLWACFS